MRKKVYIFSTKEIELSFIWKSKIKEEKNIRQVRPENDKRISLLSFYNDIHLETNNLLEKREPFLKNPRSYLDNSFIIDDKYLQKNGLKNIKYDNIYSIDLNKTGDKAFLTYIYPFTVDTSLTNAWYYWLAAYFEDICALQNIDNAEKLNDFEFIFVLHDKDVDIVDSNVFFNLRSKTNNFKEDFKSYFEKNLLSILLNKYSNNIKFQFCYMHNGNAIHDIIKTFNPKNGGDLLEKLNTAAKHYKTILPH